MDVRILGAAQYYRILDLEPGASPEEVHQGYLDMTWVWHPDRFVGHPRLQQKAHYKIQQVNEAHDKLRSYQSTTKTQEIHPKQKSQPAPPPPQKSESTGLYKPQGNRHWGGEEQQTTKEYNSRVRFKAKPLDDWLD